MTVAVHTTGNIQLYTVYYTVQCCAVQQYRAVQQLVNWDCHWSLTTKLQSLQCATWWWSSSSFYWHHEQRWNHDGSQISPSSEFWRLFMPPCLPPLKAATGNLWAKKLFFILTFACDQQTITTKMANFCIDQKKCWVNICHNYFWLTQSSAEGFLINNLN